MEDNPEKSRALSDPEKPAREAQVVQSVKDRARERARAPCLKMEYDEETNTSHVTYDQEVHETAHLLAVADIGTSDGRFFRGLMTHIEALGEPGRGHSACSSDFAPSVVRSVEPRDEVEAMLAAQMVAVHQATLSMARKLNTAEYTGPRDAAERGLTQLVAPSPLRSKP